LKSIFTRISSEIGNHPDFGRGKFNIIIDDFNLLDEFTLDIFNGLLPIFQVNGINIILTERTDFPGAAEKIINKARVINLSPFTEDDLTEYLDFALATFFPKDQLKKLITRYADLLPGSIINFIRDLILLNIIRFTPDGPDIVEDEKTEKLLESSHEEIFKLRFSLLTPDEIKTAQVLSSFENLPEVNVIAVLNDISTEEVYGNTKSLEEKNILQVSNIANTLSFTSESLKKYVYSTIDDKEDYHIKIADSIAQQFSNFNRNELARQYELGKQFISSYKILSDEIDEAERLSAYSYKKNILNHLLELPLPDEYKTKLGFWLSQTLYKLNDAKSALGIIDSLLAKPNEDPEDELLILKGSCLIELGELDEGKNLLSHLVKKISDEERKQKLLVEIAYAEFDLGKYEVSEDYARRIIENDFTSIEEKAKCYNLLGLIEIYLRNNLGNAVKEFEKSLEYYKQINSILQEAKVERNIGNIYNMKGEHTSAEKFWDSAHEKNLSIGNLDQEAKHLLNYGIYYYELGAFDEAIKQYSQAIEIFSVLGSRDGEASALGNLGEVNIDICNYQYAYNSLMKAKQIFIKLANIEGIADEIFYLGKLFSSLGDKDELVKTVKEYRELVPEGSEKHTNNIKFLEYLQKENSNEELISEIKNKYQELNDRTNFVKTNILLCEACINNEKYLEAFDAINEKEFLEVCSKNSITRAHREFLIGEISTKSEKLNIPNPINCFTKAYEILKNNYVTELTWKVLLKLGEIYYERGNFPKAVEYIVYAKKLIYFIADEITETRLKEKYLMNPEREKAIQRLDFLEKELSKWFQKK
ncbi:MAG: tetratricopeptide repeat protein, partial [Ignavibacteria bacterium]|nr:tetratricopeptide repeat protein [Ignavibacteria bacterium]